MRRRTMLGTGTAALTACLVPWGGPRATEPVTEDMDGVLLRIAKIRRRAGLSDLHRQDDLRGMERRHVLYMHHAGEMTHMGADGGDPAKRARQVGYRGQILGEALAATYDGPLDTTDLWLSHATTRDVLLDPAAKHVGIFAARDRTGLVWWALAVGA